MPIKKLWSFHYVFWRKKTFFKESGMLRKQPKKPSYFFQPLHFQKSANLATLTATVCKLYSYITNCKLLVILHNTWGKNELPTSRLRLSMCLVGDIEVSSCRGFEIGLWLISGSSFMRSNASIYKRQKKFKLKVMN